MTPEETTPTPPWPTSTDHVVPYRGRQDVTFFVDAARDAGSPVLEVGCGTGRVLIPTARAGLDIVGLDLSPGMLAICRERLGQEPDAVQKRVELVEADMRGFDLGRTFTLATIPFRPFQHLLTVADQLSCLRSIHRHLVDGGALILDLFNPSIDALVNQPIGEEFREEPEFTMPDGRRVIRRHKMLAYDRATQISKVELIYYVTHPDGRQDRLVHAVPVQVLLSLRGRAPAGAGRLRDRAPLLRLRQERVRIDVPGRTAVRGEKNGSVEMSGGGEAPVIIEAYDPSWPARFTEERDRLAQALQTWIAGPIEHIGSTAIPGLVAKPVIDIMVGVETLDASRPAIQALAALGLQLYFPTGGD